MLKTNSKKARENAKKVFDTMLEQYDNDAYLLEGSALDCMIEQLITRTTDSRGRLNTMWYTTIQEAFTEAIVMDMWVYTADARDVLKAILEETDEEANRFDSDKVYKTLAAMMYREFMKKCEEYGKDFINRYVWRY